jgi:4-hydroxy-tetrahydrodipicolinate reductase
MTRLLLVGHGRMGALVESLAAAYGFEVVGKIDSRSAADVTAWPQADVAIDFSVADAVPSTVRVLAARHTSIVIGTTGWQAHEPALRDEAARAGIGVVAAPNFAIGVNLFLALAERAGTLLNANFDAWIHEMHHSAKRDAPSGTALALERALQASGVKRVDVSSTRAGFIPGTHTIGFDSPSETITLTHQARDRGAFARGALHAAQWVKGRSGWFGMKDVLGIG